MTQADCSTIGSMTPGREYLLTHFVSPHLSARP
jgi:hypothetical protein